MKNENTCATRFVRLPEILSRTGLSKSTIYKLIRQDHFPKPRQISPNCSAWSSKEIEDWFATRPQVSLSA